MSSENPRLEKLLEQRGKIENRIKQIQAKENAQKRKLDTRRKILFGVMFEGMLADNRVKEKTINSAIDGYLKNDRDRDLIKNYVASLPKPDPEPQEWKTTGSGEGERAGEEKTSRPERLAPLPTR